MKIYHLQSGMLLQRDPATDLCKTYFQIEDARAPSISLGALEKLPDGRWCLTGIPVGGPYEFTIFDDNEALTFSDIWVGDLWLLGGQSNMEGCGAYREQDLAYMQSPIPQIRAFYMDDRWDIGAYHLHELWLLKDTGLAEKCLITRGKAPQDWKSQSSFDDCGVGPGLFIARYLWEQTGIPQGLLPCGFGGTCMDDWMPENTTPTSEYQSMIRRFHAAGGNVRGIFWYQGESDLNWLCNDQFTDKMSHFIKTLRNDTGNPTLPFVQAQLNQCQSHSHLLLDNIASWMAIQQQQADMANHIPYLSTISTAGGSRHDLIHLDADSQEAAGKAMAMEMLALLGKDDQHCPRLRSIEVRPTTGHLSHGKTSVILTYDHVIGALSSTGAAYGYSITLKDEIPYLFPYKGICSVKPRGNQVEIVTVYTPEQLELGYVWYGAGPNTVCTISDSAGRYPLAMAKIPITAKE